MICHQVLQQITFQRVQLAFFGGVNEQANIGLQTHGFTRQGIVLQGDIGI